MRGLKLGLSIGRGNANRAAFGVSLTGLSTDSLGLYAEVGDHAAIGYTINPDNGTETVKWSNSADPADPATYGTGASPTDYTAGDEGALYLHVTEGDAFSPLSLFASGEAGAWYDFSDLLTLWKDEAGTDPVTTDEDVVARVNDKSGNGNHLVQASVPARPKYRTAGGLHWLEFDEIDDVFTLPINLGLAEFEASLAFDLQGENFTMMSTTGVVYSGVGISGNSSTILSGGWSTHDEYWNNTLSTNTTRAQNYTSGQASNLWFGRHTRPGDVAIRFPGVIGGFTAPGPNRVHQALYRVGTMTDEQRLAWSTFALAKAGVTL